MVEELEAVAQRHGGVIWLFGQKLVVKPAAVAHPVAFYVKGQATRDLGSTRAVSSSASGASATGSGMPQ